MNDSLPTALALHEAGKMPAAAQLYQQKRGGMKLSLALYFP